MGKIYAPPENIKPPDFKILLDEGNKAYDKAEEKYIEEVRAFVKKRKPRAKFVGEIVRWGVADGFAAYMIASLRPVELIHLELGDAYQFQMAHRATADDLSKMVEADQKMKLAMRKNHWSPSKA